MTLYEDGADLTTVPVHNCQSNIPATSPPQGYIGSTSVAVSVSVALSVAMSVVIVVATSVATQCGFMHGGIHSVGGSVVVVLGLVGWRVDGTRGEPQGGVKDIIKFPGRFLWWKEEHPKLNGGGGRIIIHIIREGGEVGFQH